MCDYIIVCQRLESQYLITNCLAKSSEVFNVIYLIIAYWHLSTWRYYEISQPRNTKSTITYLNSNGNRKQG